VRHHTYGNLPSSKASALLDWYQNILLGDRGTWVWTTCPGSLPESGTAVTQTRDLLSYKSNAITISVLHSYQISCFKLWSNWSFAECLCKVSAQIEHLCFPEATYLFLLYVHCICEVVYNASATVPWAAEVIVFTICLCMRTYIHARPFSDRLAIGF